MTADCPARKLNPPQSETGPDLERIDHGDTVTWVIRSFDLARQLLRQSDATEQAGFNADQLHRWRRDLRPPILYVEGDQHRLQRRAAARFFAPAVIETYRPMMERLAEELVSQLRHDRATDLSRLSMRLAVQVAARVIGLTESSLPEMSRRLGAFFRGPSLSGARGPGAVGGTLTAGAHTAAFYVRDVRPAIRDRRRTPREDIISQLIELGFTDVEILTECLTYAAAGMATTRELVSAAAWHLIGDPVMLARFRAGELAERRALVEELLRIEPVVGYLRRRTVRPVTLTGPDGSVLMASGDAVDIRLRVINEDRAVVGDDAGQVCPGRALPPSVPPAVMSFGDGHHRCPGGPLAIMETEIFLTRLFSRDIVADGPPRVRWNPVSQGYDLDRFRVRSTG